MAELGAAREAFVAEFDAFRESFVATVSAMDRLPEACTTWVDMLMKEVVPGGKMTRGLTVVATAAECTDMAAADAIWLGWVGFCECFAAALRRCSA